MTILSAPLGPFGRRLGHPVVLGAEVLVHLHRLEPVGDRVLQVLQHPEPPAVVEGDGHRLLDHRLAGDQLDLQALGHLERLLRLLGRNRRRDSRRHRRVGRVGDR